MHDVSYPFIANEDHTSNPMPNTVSPISPLLAQQKVSDLVYSSSYIAELHGR